MSQTYAELNGTDTLKASRSTINTNFDAIKTGFSGTSAPFTASSTTLGATYYNTSDKKTYRVVQSGSNYVWTDINTLMPTAETESDTTVGANTAFVTKAVSKTNCPTEIPQDIKYTFADNVFTLKSGSVLTAPDGTQVQLTYDKAIGWTGSGQVFAIIRRDNQAITTFGVNRVVSGSTDSLSGTTYHVWYDTTNNVINCYTTNTTTPDYTAYLPIGIITLDSSKVKSVDTIFNGFGYIGSSIFALPGVKYLATNGLNADGTLKSTAITLNSLVIRNFTLGNNNYTAWLNHQGQIGNTYSTSVVYDAETNFITSSGTAIVGCVFVDYTIESNNITKFEPKTAFHAADYYDLNKLANEISTLDSGNVKTTGNQSIAGNKTLTGTTTFSGSVSLGSSATATTKGATTNSTAVATTAFVKLLVPVSIGSGTKPVYTNSSGVITASNSDVGSATQPIYMNKGTLTAGIELNTAAYVADNTLVHKAGTEEITGNKTFTSQLALNAGLKFNHSSEGYITVTAKNSAINIGTAPSTNTGYQVNLEDATGGLNHCVGGFVTIYKTNGSTETQIRAYKPNDSGQTQAEVAVIYPASGNPYATCPTPGMTTSTSSTNMVNAGWVNSPGNNVMHLTGNESVGGIKTVTNHWNFKIEQTISNTGVTKGTNPSSAQYSSLTFCDKNGTGFGANQLGNVQHKLDTDGTSTTALTAIKNDANSTATASIGVAYKDDGTTYGYAPTPSSATDNSTKIATTAWVRNHICTTKATTTSTASVDAPASVVKNYVNGTKWYRIWSDGWIEQGGEAGANTSFTLAHAFSNTNYTVASVALDDHDKNPFIKTKTTSAITFQYKCSFYACGY